MASTAEVRNHYDTPAALFELFLDDHYLSYSAGQWQDHDDLETAQTRNLTAITHTIALDADKSVLDIGCGWGAFTCQCLEQATHAHYLGLTPSPAQIAYIKHRFPHHPALRETTWQSYAQNGQRFDALVALESTEHIASYKSRRDGTAIKEYRHFFQSCAELSKDHAPLYLQTSAVQRLPRTRAELKDWNFLLHAVFAGSALPDLPILEQASDSSHAITQCDWNAEDYIKTLQAWCKRLRSNEDAFITKFGQRQYHFYQTYLESCIRLFDSGIANLLRLRLEKK